MEDGRESFVLELRLDELIQSVDKAVKEVNRFGSTAESIGRSVDEAFDEITKSAKENEQSMKGLYQTYIDMSKQSFAAVKSGAKDEADAIDERMKAIRKEIDERAQLAEEIAKQAQVLKKIRDGESTGTTRKTADDTVRLRTRMRELNDELSKMEMEGKRNTDEFRRLSAEAAKLNDQLGDTQQRVRILAADDKGFQGVISGINGVAGAMSVAQGAMGMFAGESEDLQRVMLRVQSLMSITMGLQQVENVLNKDSAFQVVVVAKAKEFLANANRKLAAALKITNTQAKILTATLSLGLTAAIGAAIYLIEKMISQQEKARKAAKEFNSEVASSAAKPIATFRTLQEEWNRLGNNMEAKQKYIKENADKFRDLDVSIKGVADAERMLNEGAETFVKSQMAKAKAIAASNLAAQKYEKIIEKQAEVDKMADWGYQYQGSPNAGGGTSVKVINTEKIRAQKELEEMKKDADSLITQAVSFSKEEQELLASIGLKHYEATKEAGEKTKKAIDELEVNKERLEQLQNDYNSRISREVRDAANALRTAETNEIEDGYEREAQQLTQAYDRAMQEVADKREEWIKEARDYNRKLWEEMNPNWKKEGLKYEAPEANLTKEQEQALKDMEKAAEINYARGARNLVEQLQQEYATVEQAIDKIRKEYAAKRKAMYADDSYTTLREGFSQENVNNLNREEREAIEAINVQFASKEEVFQQWMGQIANFTLEELKRALDAAQKELDKLIANGGDSKSVTLARAKIATLQGMIKQGNLSPKKAATEWNELYKVLTKVGDEFGEIGDMVGGLAGEMIKAAGQLASSTVTMINGIQTLAQSSVNATKSTAEGAAAAVSTAEKASVILTVISAAAQAISTIFSFFNKSDSQEKWEKAQKVYEGTVEALDWAIEKQREYARTLAGREAVEAYEIAIANVKREQEAARTLAQQYMNAGASMGSHSHGVENLRNISLDTWQKVAQFFGMDTSGIMAQLTRDRRFGIDPSAAMAQFMQGKLGSRLEGLFSLDIEQLEQLKTEVPELYGSLDEQARQYYDSIIAAEQKIKDIENERMESLTGITDTTLADDWAELLTSMDASSKNFADNLENYLRQAVVNSLIKDKYQEKLSQLTQAIYEGLSDGTLTREEIDALREEYKREYEKAIADRKRLDDELGFSTTLNQSSTSRGFEAMSQDTANELNGRFTALQMSNEQISGYVHEMVIQAASVSTMIEEMQAIGMQSLTQLETIAKNSNELPLMNERLEKIEKNTRNL